MQGGTHEAGKEASLEMKSVRFFILMSVLLTGALAFILLVPVTETPNGRYTECDPNGCVNVVQYQSISYAYGGWGGVFQSGVNLYSLNGWSCSCPAATAGHVLPCCIPPLAYVLWPILGLVFIGDLGCVAVAARVSGRSHRVSASARSGAANRTEAG